MKSLSIYCLGSYWPLLLIGLFFAPGCAPTIPPEKFDSATDASNAIVQAVRDGSADRVKQVLGTEGAKILGSGDAVADRNAAEAFLAAYDEKHTLVNEPGGGVVTIVVGANDWPMPIPIVQDEFDGKWYFDTEAGKEEIINRRVGRNELDVVEVCRAIVDAEMEYAMRDPNGDGVPEYASKFMSDPGKKNGLYWPTAEGEAPSPLGALVADAVDQGYGFNRVSAEPRPYHGYMYRILTSQGPDAEGGAYDYMINGKMIGGFAVVAYPAEYGSSGVYSFIVNHRGVVYQKDLGKKTAETAKAMKSFNPGAGWQAVPEATGSTAG